MLLTCREGEGQGMKYIQILVVAVLISGFATISFAEAENESPAPQISDTEKKKGNPTKGMSQEELINLALSAAPLSISKNASVIIPNEEGKQFVARKGTNGFICFADTTGQNIPYPFCADNAAVQWMKDLLSGAPKPTTTVPGIVYMARGGFHFEKNGKTLMKAEEGAKAVTEPPHWMLYWPFDSQATGIPSFPGSFGTYIMSDGTPYAHLMIYQDPDQAR